MHLSHGFRPLVLTPALIAALSSTCASAAEYAYDDGVSNILLGPPDSFSVYGDIDMLWGNYYFTQSASEQVTAVSFGLGELSAGAVVSVWIFEDPDNDANPTNAVPVFSLTTTGANLGFGFNELSVTPTTVNGGFFVAIGHLAELVTDESGDPDFPSPARYDPNGRADRSWFFYDSDIPEENLGSSGFVQRMDGPFVPIPGAFAVRATTVPGVGGVGLLAVVMGLRGRRRGR